MAVILLPPSESFNSHVKTESLYGTMDMFLFFFLPIDRSAKAAMTRPRVDKERLISAPSLSRAPVAPVEVARSEPARSTRLILATFSVSIRVSTSCLFWVTVRVKTAWERLDVSFMLVAATVRALFPSSIKCSISWKDLTASFARSSTYGPVDGCSRTLRLPLVEGLRRSRTRSL